ncbi:Mn-containing catalase, partial [Salmonella enterica subsp. enterica serovar 4,12:i:-]|nr:Mn-containing catalase [Salmonella enterica subsp. enterica serovar 4,12:i:-]
AKSTADLPTNNAAEARAKIIYDRLINLPDDPGKKHPLIFLMPREAAPHLFLKKALFSIRNTSPPDKLPPVEQYTDVYYNMSQGDDPRGSWNSDENFNYVAEPMPAVDGGDGLATVKLPREQMALLKAMAERTKSDPTVDPLTGAELGCGEPKEDK